MPPNDPAFQKRVILAALGLLEAEAGGPVLLADFADDDPREVPDESWQPPVDRPHPNPPPPAEEGVGAALADALEAEMRELASAYAQSCTARGRSTVGLSGLAPAAFGEYIASWLRGTPPPSPVPDMSPVLCLRFAVDDLKAYCLEAALAGGGAPSSRQLGDRRTRHQRQVVDVAPVTRLIATSQSHGRPHERRERLGPGTPDHVSSDGAAVEVRDQRFCQLARRAGCHNAVREREREHVRRQVERRPDRLHRAEPSGVEHPADVVHQVEEPVLRHPDGLDRDRVGVGHALGQVGGGSGLYYSLPFSNLSYSQQVFSETITDYRDEAGELVVTARSVGVMTEKPVSPEEG
jgi:hypothetical protein